MPNLRSKRWTTTTPAAVTDAQYWEDHLIGGTLTLVDSDGETLGVFDGSTNVEIEVGTGSGGGHVIEAADGSEMAQEPILQFVNAQVSEGTGKTIVDCQGEKGDAATIEVGTVTTLPAGSLATVTNSGTTSEAVFDFGIPKGADGADGDDGNKWYRGTGISGKSASPTIYSGSGVTLAVIGDMFLNPDEGAIYNCTLGGNASTAKWVYLMTLTGGGGGTSDYADLSNKPKINNHELSAGNNTLNTLGIAAKTHSHVVSDITDFPTIPTVNDATLTVKQNGTSVGTFSANASQNAEVDITADANVIESIKVNGVTQTITNKTVDLDVVENPTNPDLNDVLKWNGSAWIADGIIDQSFNPASANAQSGLAVAGAISGKANISQLDSWSSEATLASGNTVTFTGLNDSYGYELFSVDDEKPISWSDCTKTGSGTSMQLVYTVSGASLQVGISKFVLRILK